VGRWGSGPLGAGSLLSFLRPPPSTTPPPPTSPTIDPTATVPRELFVAEARRVAEELAPSELLEPAQLSNGVLWWRMPRLEGWPSPAPTFPTPPRAPAEESKVPPAEVAVPSVPPPPPHPTPPTEAFGGYGDWVGWLEAHPSLPTALVVATTLALLERWRAEHPTPTTPAPPETTWDKRAYRAAFSHYALHRSAFVRAVTEGVVDGAALEGLRRRSAKAIPSTLSLAQITLSDQSQLKRLAALNLVMGHEERALLTTLRRWAAATKGARDWAQWVHRCWRGTPNPLLDPSSPTYQPLPVASFGAVAASLKARAAELAQEEEWSRQLRDQRGGSPEERAKEAAELEELRSRRLEVARQRSLLAWAAPPPTREHPFAAAPPRRGYGFRSAAAPPDSTEGPGLERRVEPLLRFRLALLQWGRSSDPDRRASWANRAHWWWRERVSPLPPLPAAETAALEEAVAPLLKVRLATALPPQPPPAPGELEALFAALLPPSSPPGGGSLPPPPPLRGGSGGNRRWSSSGRSPFAPLPTTTPLRGGTLS